MPYIEDLVASKEEANSFLSRKLLKNSWHHFEEAQPGNIERECLEEVCSYEEAREAFETDVVGLNKFWAQYTGVTHNSSEDNPVGLILGILFGIVGFIIIIIIIYVLWKRRKGDLDKKMMQDSQPYTPYPMLSFYESKRGAAQSNNYESPLLDNFDNDLAMGLSECYLERERLQLGEVITSGNFGDVWQGKLKMRDSSVISVAVKSLKNVSDLEDVEKFLREGVMMRGLKHENVLSLIGVCVDGDVEQCRTSPLIVLPFMKNGDLRTFLRDGNNVLTVLHLVRFCNQVALGMEYLAEKKFVHRDLAARNCMVDEDWHVKVADFGLSRDLYDRDYYRSSVKTQLPLKWMPPESIKYGLYDEKSDVWSYGVLCWEIMTRGAIPYPTIQAVAILEYLTEGKRMDRPECCPYKLYKVMKRSWYDEVERRPTFKEIVLSTNDVLHDAKKSVKRRSRSSDANASLAGSSRAANQYQNSMKEKHATETEERPKPKPRTSLKRSANERTDKYAANNKETNGKEKTKRKGNGADGDTARPSRLDSKQSHPSVSTIEVGEYNDTDIGTRTTSV